MQLPSLADLEDTRWVDRDNNIFKWHRQASEMIEQQPILDIGGGDGAFASWVRDKRGYSEFTVLDISPIAVKKAQSKGFAAQAVDITKLPLPFPENSFPTVTLIEVLEHLYDPIGMLKECQRIASDSIIFSVPNFNYLKFRLQVIRGTTPTVSLPKQRHVWWFNSRQLSYVLHQAGIVNFTVHPITPGRLGLGKVFRLMGKIWPSMFAADFVVKCNLR